MAGVWVDGMDALSVKSATAFAKKYVLENGPLMLEMVGKVSAEEYCPIQCLEALSVHGVPA